VAVAIGDFVSSRRKYLSLAPQLLLTIDYVFLFQRMERLNVYNYPELLLLKFPDIMLHLSSQFSFPKSEVTVLQVPVWLHEEYLLFLHGLSLTPYVKQVLSPVLHIHNTF